MGMNMVSRVNCIIVEIFKYVPLCIEYTCTGKGQVIISTVCEQVMLYTDTV